MGHVGCAHPNEALEGQHSAPVQQFNEDRYGLVFQQKIYKEHRNLVDFQQNFPKNPIRYNFQVTLVILKTVAF